MVYFECYEGRKLIHTSTELLDVFEMAEYVKHFPERTVVRIEKTFFHHIEIYSSEQVDCCSEKKLVGKITVSDEDFNKILKIPHLGCGSAPIEGCYCLVFAKNHLDKVLKYGIKTGQLTFSDFIKSKKTPK